MKKSYPQLKQKIKKAKSVLLLGHIEPDGDAIGSMIMFEGVLKALNPKLKITKKISTVYREPVAFYVKKYNFTLNEARGRFDLVVALDTSTVARLPQKIAVDVNIDHHADNEQFGKLNIVDKKAATAGLIVAEIAQAWKIPLNKKMAEGLYLSLYTDTGSFSFANTDQKCFELAALCVKCGVDPHQVYRNVNEQKDLWAIKAFGDALRTIDICCEGRLIIAQIEDEESLDNRTLIDYIRQEKNSLLAAVLVKKNDYVKVSLRAKANIDVSAVARAFNGGGHYFAAAGKIMVKDLGEAKKILVDYIEKNVF